MVKYGAFNYNLVRTETSREGIEKILAESGHRRLQHIAEQVKSIDVLEFSDSLPSCCVEEANESAAFTVSAYLNEFPEMEKHFPLGRPILPVAITAAREYFIVRTETGDICAHKGTTAGSVTYSQSTIYHAVPGLDLKDISNRASARGKFTAILDSTSHKTRLLCTDNFVGIIAFATPMISEETLMQHLLYEAAHEAVHLVTMPAIIKQGLDACNEEKLDVKMGEDGRMCINMSRKDALSVKEFYEKEEFKSAIEITAYSIGTIMHSLYNASKGRSISVKPSDYTGAGIPFIAKADEIFLQSGSSLKQCNNLAWDEINLLFRGLERLKYT